MHANYTDWLERLKWCSKKCTVIYCKCSPRPQCCVFGFTEHDSCPLALVTRANEERPLLRTCQSRKEAPGDEEKQQQQYERAGTGKGSRVDILREILEDFIISNWGDSNAGGPSGCQDPPKLTQVSQKIGHLSALAFWTETTESDTVNQCPVIISHRCPTPMTMNPSRGAEHYDLV